MVLFMLLSGGGGVGGWLQLMATYRTYLSRSFHSKFQRDSILTLPGMSHHDVAVRVSPAAGRASPSPAPASHLLLADCCPPVPLRTLLLSQALRHWVLVLHPDSLLLCLCSLPSSALSGSCLSVSLPRLCPNLQSDTEIYVTACPHSVPRCLISISHFISLGVNSSILFP